MDRPRGVERAWTTGLSCLAVLALPCAALAAAPLTPTPLFESLGVEHGLPSSRVFEVAEDRSGFLWIATADGLARYDGVGFEVWRRDPARADSLPANDVQTVFVDREDRVWVGTVDGGLSMLDVDRRGVRTWRGGSGGDGLSGTDVWAIAQGPDGAIWAGTFNGGLNRLDPATGKIDVRRHVDGDSGSIAADTVIALHADARGRLWVGTTSGVSRLDLAQTPDGSGAARQFLAGQLVSAIRAGSGDTLWVGVSKGLWRIDGDAEPQRVDLPEPVMVEAVLDDAFGRRWFATRRGLFLEHAPGVFAQFRREPGRAYTLTSNDLLDATRDREGGLWFPSHGGGLIHVKPQWPNFTLLRPSIVEGRTIDDVPIRALSRCPDGSILANSSPGALWRIDPVTGTDVRIELPWRDQQVPRVIHVVLCARDGSYWIGHRGGVARFDAAAKTMRTWRGGRADGVEAGMVDQLYLDDDDRVWASVRAGALERLSADGARERHLAWDPAADGREVEQIVRGPDGAPWVVGNLGVARFDRAASRWVRLEGAPTQRIESVAFDGENDLWLHTMDGLQRFRREGDTLRPQSAIGPADGLPVTRSSGLVLDGDRRLWIVAPGGLWRIDTATRAVRSFGRADGMMSAEFAEYPPQVAPDGSMFLAGALGVVAFDPSKVKENAVAPSVVITGVSVLREGRRETLDPTRPIALSHADRDLRVTLRALSLADPQANRYRFRLAGFDPDWVDNGNRGEREYSQLPEGRYVLEAEAANPSGVWTRAPVGLQVRVAAPPWRSWWALAAYALGLGLVGWLAFRGWQARVERAHALALAEERRLAAERQNQAKTDFLADVGHEIRTPMTGLLGMTELLLRSGLDPRQHEFASTVRRSGEHLLKLIDDLLDLSRIEAGRLELDPHPTDLWALVDEVVALQSALAAERGLGLAARVDPDAPRHVLVDATRLKEVLLNLVNNALKFTARGRVEVELLADGEPGALRLAVSDTGPGMGAETVARLFARFEQGVAPRRRGSSGLGLAISRRLVELMGGRIEVDTAPGAGTTFRVHLRLPVAEPASTETATASEARAESAALDLLVVEDDDTIRQVLVGLLGALGHRVEAGANGLDALRLLGERRFDAAVFDLDLPGVDGLRLARMVRKRPGADAALPLVALTANSTTGIEAQCREAGFDAFLRKPAGAAALAAAIAHARESRAAGGGAAP
jgi:signal transduction histidine kinase/CheY-like chemotaxis protein